MRNTGVRRERVLSLVDILIRELGVFEGSATECLQAIGCLRAETWIAALSVIIDAEGPTRAAHSLEALAQADTLLVTLALGWMPDEACSQTSIPLTPNARALYRRLVRALGRCLKRGLGDPGETVRAIEATYRECLTRILRDTPADGLGGLLAIHYAFRRLIVRSTLDLIGAGSLTFHQPLRLLRGGRLAPDRPDAGGRTVPPPGLPGDTP